MTVRFRWDWNDAEAIAAGWRPDTLAAPWRDTMRHAGRIVVLVPSGGQQAQFDLDSFSMRTRWE